MAATQSEIRYLTPPSVDVKKNYFINMEEKVCLKKQNN